MHSTLHTMIIVNFITELKIWLCFIPTLWKTHTHSEKSFEPRVSHSKAWSRAQMQEMASRIWYQQPTHFSDRPVIWNGNPLVDGTPLTSRICTLCQGEKMTPFMVDQVIMYTTWLYCVIQALYCCKCHVLRRLLSKTSPIPLKPEMTVEWIFGSCFTPLYTRLCIPLTTQWRWFLYCPFPWDSHKVS